MPKKKKESGHINEGLSNRITCFLCGTWALEKHLHRVLLSGTQELICSTCNKKFLEGDRMREMDNVRANQADRSTTDDEKSSGDNYILD